MSKSSRATATMWLLREKSVYCSGQLWGYSAAIFILHGPPHRLFIFNLVMPKWSKILMKLFISQHNMKKFCFHQKADQIIYFLTTPWKIYWQLLNTTPWMRLWSITWRITSISLAPRIIWKTYISQSVLTLFHRGHFSLHQSVWLSEITIQLNS